MPNDQRSRPAAARRLQRSTLCFAVGAALASVAPLAAAQANAVTGGDIPGSFKLPGSDTSVKIGGYVKLDALYNSVSSGVNSAADQALTPGAIPIGAARDNEGDQFTMHARQSRINVITSTPSAAGTVTTFIEGDFFGGGGNEVVSNSHGFRLRHAWGTIGSFGAGQFWTNFLNTKAFTDTLDFGGPAAQLFVRQSQVRWTQKFGGGEWAISAESPEAVIVPAAGASVIPDDDRFPDLTARIDFGRFAISGIVRNIRIDTPAADQDEWGGALYISGRIPVGKDDLRFGLYGGNAIGRYTNGFNVDGILDAGGSLDLPKVYGGFVAYRHLWSGNLRSSLVLSASSADNPSGTQGTVNKENVSLHANLIWSPARTVDVGVEYIYAERTIESGASGDLNRLQFSAQYSF